MRYYLSLLIAVVLLAGVFTTNAMAQGMRMTPEERVKMMKDSLGLNDQQAAQIDSIFMDMGAQRQALMDSVTDRDARREAMMSMMKAADDKIEALLTPDQKDKYEAMKKARQEMMRQRQN
ncbi:MAG: Spy/CpxP family protein refolding chaperone [Bacteroidota bacterium]